MHELGIAQSILETALAEASAAGGARVHVVRVRLGRLSGVVREALEFAFGVIRSGTAAAEAELEFEDVAARLRCGGCGAEYVAGEDFGAPCPACGGVGGRVIAGREIEIASLEIS